MKDSAIKFKKIKSKQKYISIYLKEVKQKGLN